MLLSTSRIVVDPFLQLGVDLLLITLEPKLILDNAIDGLSTPFHSKAF